MDGIKTDLTEVGQSEAKAKAEASSTSNILGKDDFLKLLVTQMQYQDPLNPQTDTDFIAQLAQFSSLEQMQNLNTTSVNSQALGLVGKEVVVSTTNASGVEGTVQGTVDYVTIKNGSAFLSINGSLYDASNVVTVMDSYYAVQKYVPSVDETQLAYDKNQPLDLSLKISLGEKGYEASSVAVIVNGEAVSAENMSYSDGVLTIKKEALAGLDVGEYEVALHFDDVLSTTITDKVTIKVTDSTETSNQAGSTEESEGE